MKVLLLAGEESGLMYADRIRARLSLSDPNAEIRGYADYGFDVGDLAVMGFFAVLRKIRFFLRVKRTLEAAINDWRPDVVCTVDYPGLNLKIAAYAKTHGVRTVHVVCPQVWAWRAGRIPKIEASVDRLCCFFPFEPALFRPGFAIFVGHPLVEEFAALRSVGVEPNKDFSETYQTVALLPGSRVGEIERILPTLLEAAAELYRRHPQGLRFVIPAANARAGELIRTAVSTCSIANVVDVRSGGARDLLVREATCAAVASGTATLEAALAGCPTVLVYRVGRFLAWFARQAIKGIRHVGLANIIAEKSGLPCPMPELLQEDLTVENLVRTLDGWLTDVSSRGVAVAQLETTMRTLASTGHAIERIVASIL